MANKSMSTRRYQMTNTAIKLGSRARSAITTQVRVRLRYYLKVSHIIFASRAETTDLRFQTDGVQALQQERDKCRASSTAPPPRRWHRTARAPLHPLPIQEALPVVAGNQRSQHLAVFSNIFLNRKTQRGMISVPWSFRVSRLLYAVQIYQPL